MELDRRTFTSGVVASGATLLAPAMASATAPQVQPAKNVVLVHGLFADASS
jgi:hypothetical protein